MNLKAKPILKELRFVFSPIDKGSFGIKSYLEKNFNFLSSQNYKLLIRESSDIEATVIARYSKNINFILYI